MTRIVFLATIPFGVLSLVMTFLLHEVTEYMSNETVFGLQREKIAQDPDEAAKAVAEQYEQVNHAHDSKA
jgi:hypothetical protein